MSCAYLVLQPNSLLVGKAPKKTAQRIGSFRGLQTEPETATQRALLSVLRFEAMTKISLWDLYYHVLVLKTFVVDLDVPRLKRGLIDRDLNEQPSRLTYTY